MVQTLSDVLLEHGFLEDDVPMGIKIVSDIHNNNGLSFRGIMREGNFFENVKSGSEAFKIVEKVQRYLDRLVDENILFGENVKRYVLTEKTRDLYFDSQ